MAAGFAMRVQAAPETLFRSVGDEAVLLNLKTGVYFGVNAVGTRMWILLTGSGSIQSAYETLLSEFDVSAEDLRRDLDEFVTTLAERGLIELREGDLDGPAASKTQP